MKVTEYFIRKPVTTIIFNFLIILLGYLSYIQIGVREYPDIKFPVITVNTYFPNASAEAVESSVTNVLEEKLSGIEGLDSIQSFSNPTRSEIELKFKPKTSMDRSLIAVKDAISSARADLPDQVKEPVIERSARASGPPFMAACMESESMSFSELTHYANINIKNVLKSVKGVSQVTVWGRPYTYKITLENSRLNSFGINADEVYRAISSSDVTLASGKFQRKTPTTIVSELKSLEDFEQIIVRNGDSPVYLRDLAKIELTEQDQKLRLKINGKPGLCIGVQKSSEDNPLEISKGIYQQIDLIKKNLPDGVKIEVSLDQASFIRSSLASIKSSIFEAIFLVLVIVFIFLRNIRSTIIPIITIPISLLGSLLFLKAFGFTLNIMTLLAMVLAIGLVVDDAIVVLENITRHIEKGKTPFEAAIKGSREIFFAVVAMTFTLTFVYIPIAFVEGKTAQLFTEFAVALAGSVFISGIVAISLTPLMCSKILTHHQHNLLPKLELFFVKLDDLYQKTLNQVMSYKKLVLLAVVISFSAIAFFFNVLPKELVPSEDRSLVGVFIPYVGGQDIDMTENNANKVEEAIKGYKEAMGVLTFVADYGSYVILPLKPKSERSKSADQIVLEMRGKLSSFPSFDAWPWSFSSGLPGLEDSQDVSELVLVISSTDQYQTIFEQAEKLRKFIEEKKLFKSVYHTLKIDNLGYKIIFDNEILAKLGLTKQQAAKMISIYFSGDDSLKFKKDGILYPITIEGDIKPWTLDELYLTNSKKQRISLGTLASLVLKAEPSKLEHIDQMRAFKLRTDITGVTNISDYMDKMLKAADEILPKNYKKTWAGIAKHYKENSSSTFVLLILSLLFIYAILSVQFESFLDPLIILFTVPLACFGALFAMFLFGVSLNIYSQVGLITLIGLISKHGILMVDFANHSSLSDKDFSKAIKEAAAIRLRPILMTTCAMICGAIPLITSNSEGSEARYAMGIVLLSGLGIGTFFTLFILPTIYVSFKNLQEKI